MQPRGPAPRSNPAPSGRRRRLRRAMERRSSCRAWNAGLAPLPQGSRKLRARNAPGSPRAAAAVLTSRQFNAHHRCRCPSPRRLPTFRRLSTTPASGSSNLMSLFHSTGAWGTILQIATTTYATISPDSGSVPLLPGRLPASPYGANHRHSSVARKRHRSDCLNDIYLFAPTGVHAEEFHSPRFENAEVPARVLLHKNHGRSERLSAGSERRWFSAPLDQGRRTAGTPP